MTQISRPVLAALLAAVGFAGLWFTTLKPSPSASAGTAATAPPPTLPGVAGLGRAVTKAHAAVAAANAQSAAAATLNPGAAATATPVASAPAAASRPAATPAAPVPAAAPEVAQITGALGSHEIVVLLFHDPSGASDAAARAEFAAVPHRPGTVMVTLPISAVADVPAVTQGVAVTSAPSVVIVDRTGHATVIAGFADRAELAGRIAAAGA